MNEQTMQNLPKAVVAKVPRGRTNVVTALDIGGSKVGCFIATANGLTAPALKGSGLVASQGMRRGEVIDAEALAVAVGQAVEQAEHEAGFEVGSVAVSLNGGGLRSATRRHEVEIRDGRITEHDIIRALNRDAESAAIEADAGRTIIHRIPTQYLVDGVGGIRDATGMHASRLGVDLTIVTASAGTMQNLNMVVERNHLAIDGFCASPYAAALSTLVDDEKDLGAMVIEMGAGITGVAIFAHGNLVYLDSITYGGNDVTSDIARGLSTPLNEAERIKNLHGNVLTAIGDTEQVITLPRVGEQGHDAAQQVELGLLGDIIRPRIEEIFELLLARMEKAGFSAADGRRVVITGGAAQIPGLLEWLATLFDRQVRIGKPNNLLSGGGLATPPQDSNGSAHATTAGLLRFAAVEKELEPRLDGGGGSGGGATPHGIFRKLGQWFNDHI